MKKKKYLGETKLDSYENTPYEGYTQQDWVIEYIARYGGIDGDHHKTWVLDQVVRILKGTPVELRLAKWDDGQQEYRFSTEESSRSGTSKKTVGTASQSQSEPTSKFDFLITRAKKRTPLQTRKRLIEVGILTAEGELTAQYKTIKAAKIEKSVKNKATTK